MWRYKVLLLQSIKRQKFCFHGEKKENKNNKNKKNQKRFLRKKKHFVPKFLKEK